MHLNLLSLIFVLYNSNNNHKIISKHRRVWVEQKTQIYLLVGEQLVLAFPGGRNGGRDTGIWNGGQERSSYA